MARQMLVPSREAQIKSSHIMEEAFANYQAVDHLSLHLICPDDTIWLFSSMPEVGESLQAIDHIESCPAYHRDFYQTHCFYSWKECLIGTVGRKIREVFHQHQLYNSIVLVRHLSSTPYYLLYLIASHNPNISIQNHFINHIDHLLALGDDVFNRLHSTIVAEVRKALPKIDKFICFSQMTQEDTIHQNVAPLIFPNQYYCLTARELDCLRLAGHKFIHKYC